MYKYSDDVILRVEDGAFIPADEENRDYVAYLQWESEGGVTLPQFTDEELASKKFQLDISTENAWRTSELPIIARQIEAIEEAAADVPPKDLLPGIKQQWLKFRGQVSNWKEGSEFFPDQAKRPIRPV